MTSDTGIFRMATIVNANSTVRAVPKPGLSAIAGHIIQQDGSSSLAKCSRGEGCCTCQNVVYTHSTVSNSNTFNEEQSKISEKTVMFKLHVLCTVYIVTCRRESKLLTGYISISSSPWVITYCAPCIVVADLHPTLKSVCPANKPDVSSCTSWERNMKVNRSCGSFSRIQLFASCLVGPQPGSSRSTLQQFNHLATKDS